MPGGKSAEAGVFIPAVEVGGSDIDGTVNGGDAERSRSRLIEAQQVLNFLSTGSYSYRGADYDKSMYDEPPTRD